MPVETSPSPSKSPSAELWRGLLRSRFHLGVGIFVLVLSLADVLLSRMVHLNRLELFFDSWPALLLLTACLAYTLWRPLARLIEAAALMIWGVLLSNLLSPFILIAGRSPAPLADRTLWRIDHAFHFSTAPFVHLALHAPLLRIALALCYAVVGPMVLVALLLPPLVGKPAAARRFLLGASLSAILTAGGFALLPAAGPWTTENFPASREQAEITRYLEQLKSPSAVDVDPLKTAVVSFPSFHVALAIVAALAIGSVQRLRLAAWVLTFLVAVSTLTTGWHYGIDLLGGALVGWISILVASWIESRTRGPEIPRATSAS